MMPQRRLLPPCSVWEKMSRKEGVPQQYRYLSTKLHFLISQKNTILKIPILILLEQ